MRTTLATTTAAVIAVATPAVANQCYWVNHRIYCDAGCRVVDRWWDGYQEWMRFSCAPPPEIILVAAGVVLIVIIAIIGGVLSHTSQSTTALSKATDEADAQAAEAQRITDRLKAAAAEADRFLETYKR